MADENGEVEDQIVEEQAEGADDQVGSQDEYQIAIADGVEDETLLDDDIAPRTFAITSYGADYTVDSLVKRMRDGAFTIPEFQRRFVWTQRHASKFIESLLMGLPVPGVFLYRESDTNRHLVIDGQQRLRTLQSFYDGVFHERKFRLVGVSEPWLSKTYTDLSPAHQLKLDDSIVHATIFTQDEPKDVLDSIYFVFERINTGGIRLTAQEIRNAIASGPFVALAKELNENENWRAVYGPENKHGKDEELIIRFFAMLDARNDYSRPMSKFLTDYAIRMNGASEAVLTHHRNIFQRTIAMVREALGGSAFRPARFLNAAVFDAVMVGLAARLSEAPDPTPGAVTQAYDTLLTNADFQRGWVRSTADEENVRSRINAAIAAFGSI